MPVHRLERIKTTSPQYRKGMLVKITEETKDLYPDECFNSVERVKQNGVEVRVVGRQRIGRITSKLHPSRDYVVNFDGTLVGVWEEDLRELAQA